MSDHLSSNAASPAGSARAVMERSIDQLADLARSPVEPQRFFSAVLSAAIQPGGAEQAVLWRQSEEGLWEPAGSYPLPSQSATEAPSSETVRQAETSSEIRELLNEVARGAEPRVISPMPVSMASAQTEPENTARVQILSPIRHADQTVGILETAHRLGAAKATKGLAPETVHFFAALCEITADFLSQQELAQLRLARGVWQQWDRYQQRLWQSLEVDDVCAAVSNDGRLLAGCDRLSVLVRLGRRFVLKTVSGVERIEPRAGTTRSLELLANLAARQSSPVWINSDSASPSGNGDLPAPARAATSRAAREESRLQDALRQHRGETGAVCLGLIPLLATTGSPDSKVTNESSSARKPVRPDAILILEHFQSVADWSGWKSRGETLALRSTSVVRASLERSQLLGWGVGRAIRRLPLGLLRPSFWLVMLLLGAAIAALVWIPAELTVTGQGVLWPEHRREVFATASGIVDAVHVAHGTDVTLNQPLIELRDPDLELAAPKLAGEIATANERLKGIQTARLTGGNTPDAAIRARQLTAEEQELKEQILSLERQRDLIDQRRKDLTLISPLAGKVLTWDVAQHLTARPVERGQSLITIGETDGSWVVEVQVNDRDVRHLLQARKSIRPELDVDMVLTSNPGRTYRGHIQDVSLATEVNEQFDGQLRVIVAVDKTQFDQLRPGATVHPRIRCGQKPLGYVWFHDLIDTIRTRLLFW